MFNVLSILLLQVALLLGATKKTWPIHLLVIPIIIFLIGFSREFGPDFNDYELIFSNYGIAQDEFYNFGIEPLWLFFAFIADAFNLSSNTIFGLVASISFLMRYAALRLFFQNQFFLVFLGLMVFFLFDFVIRDMGQIRNGLVSSMICLWIALQIKYKISYRLNLFILILGTITHYSFPFFYFSILILFKINLKYIVFLALIAISIGLTASLFLENLLENFYLLNFDKILIYSSSEFNQKQITVIPVFIIISILICLIFYLFQLPHRELFLKIYIYIIAIFFLFYSFPVLSSRLSSGLTIVNMFSVPIIINWFIGKWRHEKQIIAILLILFIAISIILNFSSFIKIYGGDI